MFQLSQLLRKAKMTKHLMGKTKAKAKARVRKEVGRIS